MTRFLRLPTALIHIDTVRRIDLANLEDLVVTLTTVEDKLIEVRGMLAIEIVLQVYPSALESRRLRWVRHAWAFHNLIGHPVMQLLAFFKRYKLAMKVHDGTVPKPVGQRAAPASTKPPPTVTVNWKGITEFLGFDGDNPDDVAKVKVMKLPPYTGEDS